MSASSNVLLLAQDERRLVQWREQLAPAGVRAFVARTDHAAVELFHKNSIAAVVVDLDSMQERGLRAGERIHSEERSPQTPVFFLGGARTLVEPARVNYRAGKAEFLNEDDPGDSLVMRLDKSKRDLPPRAC
jgi:DNA-binding response OmpR family regulator